VGQGYNVCVTIVISSLAICLNWSGVFQQAKGPEKARLPHGKEALTEYEQLLDPDERRKNQFGHVSPNLLYRGNTPEFYRMYPQTTPAWRQKKK